MRIRLQLNFYWHFLRVFMEYNDKTLSLSSKMVSKAQFEKDLYWFYWLRKEMLNG